MREGSENEMNFGRESNATSETAMSSSYVEEGKTQNINNKKHNFTNHKNFKNKTRKAHYNLTIADDFRVILYGCLGIRTYKLF